MLRTAALALLGVRFAVDADGAIRAGTAVPTATTTIDATDSRITWMGRTIPLATGGVQLDWEGTAMMFTIANATVVNLQVSDTLGSGTRISVWHQSSDTDTDSRNLHVLDFSTMAGNNSYSISRGLWSNSVTYTVKNQIEPTFIGSNTNNNLTFVSITTDGIVLPAPKLPSRKIEIIGDSITAGMGARFAGPCDANQYQNSWDGTYGDLICTNLTANCNVVAWSGIGIECYYGADCDPQAEFTHNMPWTYTFTLGGQRGSADPAALWNFSRFTPDAILINLGTNDFSTGNRINNQTFITMYTNTYLQFLYNITHVYYNNPSLPIFLAMGPLSMGPAPIVQNVADLFNEAGGNATFIPLPNPGLPLGCAGHPSPALHASMAAQAIPVMQQVLGWQ